MKLTRIEIRNFRSLFTDAAGDDFVLEPTDGMNAFVGPNNCGKSNVFRALAFAFDDPNFRYDRARDRPSHTTNAIPTVTLDFEMPRQGRTSQESTLLRYLGQYEKEATGTAVGSYASRGKVKLRVSLNSDEHNPAGRRHAAFVSAGAGARKPAWDDPIALKCMNQFSRCIHFVYIQSGQSLEDLLTGSFRDILRNVLREHLGQQFRTAEASRAEYVRDLKVGLLAPLRDRILQEMSAQYPEITDVDLRPDVPDLDETLAGMDIGVGDRAMTGLADKGTGVRGSLLIAVLRHLAETGRRSLLFAVEEPESFLHPAAQEEVRGDLEALAERRDVSLLVTTHSPYIPSRHPEATTFKLDKEGGRTVCRLSTRGDRSQADVLAGLFRDRAVLDFMDRVATIESEASATVVVEGWTDLRFAQIAMEAADRMDLLDGVNIVHPAAGGAAPAAAEFLVRQSVAGQRVLVLLDNDDEGKKAQVLLRQIGEKSKGWNNKKTILHYGLCFSDQGRPWEAENLWPPHLLEEFVVQMGRDVYTGSKRLPGGAGWSYDFRPDAKRALVEFLAQRVERDDTALWVSLYEKVHSNLFG